MLQILSGFLFRLRFLSGRFYLIQVVKMVVIRLITVIQQCQYVTSFTRCMSNVMCELYKLFKQSYNEYICEASDLYGVIS